MLLRIYARILSLRRAIGDFKPATLAQRRADGTWRKVRLNVFQRLFGGWKRCAARMLDARPDSPVHVAYYYNNRRYVFIIRDKARLKKWPPFDRREIDRPHGFQSDVVLSVMRLEEGGRMSDVTQAVLPYAGPLNDFGDNLEPHLPDERAIDVALFAHASGRLSVAKLGKSGTRAIFDLGGKTEAQLAEVGDAVL